MDKIEALNLLEVNKLENIEKQFSKMMRRYPPEFFPEKAEKIRNAYLLLKNDWEYWKNLIDGKGKLLTKTKIKLSREKLFEDFREKVEYELDNEIKRIERSIPHVS